MLEVLITDANSGGYEHNRFYFSTLDLWAQKQCPSYLGYDVVDVSDNSLLWDEIASYKFGKEKDVAWFQLKWKTD